jgi:hypothetical protein
MLLDDLFVGEVLANRLLPEPEMNPFREHDALRDAQILEVRLDAVRARVGILFEFRTALQLRGGNTAVLVADGVRSVAWEVISRDAGPMAWSIIESSATPSDGVLRLVLTVWPSGGLVLTAERAALTIGTIPSLPAAPPNYVTDDAATVRAETAQWTSTFAPVQAVFAEASTE